MSERCCRLRAPPTSPRAPHAPLARASAAASDSGAARQEEAQDPGWLCCAFDQSSLCGYIKFSLLQNVLILLALGLVGAAVYTVLELKPTTLGTVLIVVTMVTAVTSLVTTPASMLFDALRQGMSGGKKDGVIPAARMQSSVGFSDDSHAKPPENDTNAFSFSIMALVIGFVLVLVVTALVVQIIFQTLVVQMSLESGLVLNDSTVLFTKRVTGELHTRAYQIVTEWINSAVSCAEFTADALRDRRLNVSDTEMIATYLHRSHSVFNIEALSVATALGEVFAVEYPHIHTSVIDVDPYSLGDQIDYFVTNRELNPSAEFTGVNKPLVRYTLNDTSRFDVGSAAVQGFRSFPLPASRSSESLIVDVRRGFLFLQVRPVQPGVVHDGARGVGTAHPGPADQLPHRARQRRRGAPRHRRLQRVRASAAARRHAQRADMEPCARHVWRWRRGVRLVLWQRLLGPHQRTRGVHARVVSGCVRRRGARRAPHRGRRQGPGPRGRAHHARRGAPRARL